MRIPTWLYIAVAIVAIGALWQGTPTDTGAPLRPHLEMPSTTVDRLPAPGVGQPVRPLSDIARCWPTRTTMGPDVSISPMWIGERDGC